MPIPETFHTARLEATRIGPEHLADLRVLHRDPEAMAELGGVRSDEATDEYLARNEAHWREHGFGVWMLRPKESDRWIGRVILRWLRVEPVDDVEIGFTLQPASWGQGFATEAASFCLELARTELELDTLVGITTSSNERSQRVLNKLGLRHEADVEIGGMRWLVHRVRW